jgi:hypothetical protein
MSQHEAIWLGSSGLVDISKRSEQVNNREESDEELTRDI